MCVWGKSPVSGESIREGRWVGRSPCVGGGGRDDGDGWLVGCVYIYVGR